jgi:DNA-binding MarR family transcriptional regulator
VTAYLTRKVQEQHGNIVVFGAGDEMKGRGRWRSLTRNPLAAVPDQLLSPEGFSYVGMAKHAYPKATNLRTWAEANQGSQELARDVCSLLALGVPEIQALERIGLHPPATIRRLRAAGGTVRDRNQMRAKVHRLEDLGLVRTREDAQTTITITQSGISLLGALSGISAELADELLGWPNRPQTYARQREHYQRITGFLLWLHRAGRVEDWSTMKCRYRFRDVSVGAVQRWAVTIHPDGEGDFVFCDGRKVRFWLEVDRGTRTGRRFSAQLEKYYLIRYARIQAVNIPVLLYITDTGGEQDEGRLRSAARRLARQGQTRYPESRLHILFTTGDLIDRFDEGDPGVVRIWRRFARGRLERELLSLEQGLIAEGGVM